MACVAKYLVALLIFFLIPSFANACLSPRYYCKTCPNLQNIVRDVMREAINNETRLGASILRLFFHDCFVNGCDGSVLLEDTANFTSERTAFPNGALRGFEVIDEIKERVEAACKNIVSCADILAIAARDGVYLLGGPTWKVLLGRTDSRAANLSAANTNLPTPFQNLSTLIALHEAQGLSTRDMTALSGGHTIGLGACITFRSRIYNDTNIDPEFAALRRATCPPTPGDGDLNLAPLDLQTPEVFDNKYYQNLVAYRGLFHSDQELFNNGSEDELVRLYATNQAAFFRDFVTGMIRMGNNGPPPGIEQEIRRNCSVINSY